MCMYVYIRMNLSKYTLICMNIICMYVSMYVYVFMYIFDMNV